MIRHVQLLFTEGKLILLIVGAHDDDAVLPVAFYQLLIPVDGLGIEVGSGFIQ